MSLAQKIKSRFDEKPRRVIEVPEWGDDGAPLVLYVSELTGGDLKHLQRKHKDFLNNQTMDAMVDLIILKAELEDGKRAFTLEDKPIIMSFSLTSISTLAGKMFGDIETIDDHEKN